MARPPIHHVDVRAFRYATEVPERVEAALRLVYPPLDEDGTPLERDRTEGHYGHPIDVYSLSLSTRADIRIVIDRLQERGDIEAIIDELPIRVTEDCDLFLRFDKQRAYTDDRLVFGDGIELRLRLEAYPAKRGPAIDNAREYLTGLVDTTPSTEE